MAETIKLVIRNDEDAWSALQAIWESEQSREPDRPTYKLTFKSWPQFSVTSYRGEAEIDTSTMEGYLALQHAIYRSFNVFYRQTRQLRAFTAEDRERLRLSVKVKKGSSFLNVDLTKIISDLLTSMGSKMDGNQSLIFLLGAGLIIGGTVVWKSWISERAKVRIAEADTKKQADVLSAFTKLSQEETERMKLLTRVERSVPALQTVREEIDNVRHDYIRHLPDEKGADLEGTVLSPEALQELKKKARNESDEVTLEGTYRVSALKDEPGSDWTLTLEDIETGEKFPARFGDLLTSIDQRVAVERATFAKQPIQLTIQARNRGGRIVNAQIVWAEVTDDSTDN